MEKTARNTHEDRAIAPRPEPPLPRPAEAARFLASSLSRLCGLTNGREVPAIRIGRALRYPTDELRAWVAVRSGGRS